MSAVPPIDLPDVSVVIATRGRPELLRAAVRAILAQDYAGAIELVVVFDGIDIDPLTDVVMPNGRALATIANGRAAGLAGGRNTGIEATSGALVAFCDDDDEWLPEKLARQVELFAGHPEAILVATGIRIQTADASHVRLPPAVVSFDDLLESRITELHPSSFLIRRRDLLGEIGLVDEQLPMSYGEDYDLLLRAARFGTILSVLEPLVIVHWNRASFFADRWQGIADGLGYVLLKHPEFATSPRGSARIEGQIAFAYGALRNRPEAWAWSRRALRHDRRQLRAWAAMLVSLRLAPAGALVRLVNSRGRGM
ncbi:MAG: glycosyl transferase family 2 [Microbacteriaceae bacterium]|nr:glycosyl transferase family 2 [Microbacteriaceae bacterium]